MTFPLEILAASPEAGLLVAAAIGFGFGFVLERAGFGRADKLAAQFFLSDMTVFKVMFTAIITAMLGIVLFDAAGLVELAVVREQIASATWIVPMLIGGLVLGAGFMISGYCPGTSIVAATSGNIDGAFTVAGVMGGTWIYSELMRIPSFAAFHESSARGPMFLDTLLGVPPELLAGGFALMAVLAFLGAEKVEKLVARRREPGTAPAPTRLPGRRFAFSTVLGFAAVSLLTAAVPHGAASTRLHVDPVDASTLAHRVVEEPWTIRILDFRPAAAFAAASIPASENVDRAAVANLGLEWSDPSRDLVVIADEQGVPEDLGRYEGRVLLLEGGFDAWKRYALDAAEIPAGAGAAEIAEARFRSALRSALTGAAAPAPTEGKRPTVTRPKKKGGGCSA